MLVVASDDFVSLRVEDYEDQVFIDFVKFGTVPRFVPVVPLVAAIDHVRVAADFLSALIVLFDAHRNGNLDRALETSPFVLHTLAIVCLEVSFRGPLCLRCVFLVFQN